MCCRPDLPGELPCSRGIARLARGVLGIFPGHDAIICLDGAVLAEQNDE
jgi:hypothetical protein